MIHRRGMLSRACVLGSLPLLAGQAEGAEPSRKRKLKVIVTGGHPGDPEYGCGGTVARLTDLGHEVVLVYLNNGVPTGKPNDGVRVAEAGKACAILKARPVFAGQTDGDAIVDRAHYDALYYYEVSNGEDTVQFAPTEYVDISETEQRKRQACFAHASQAPDKFYELQSRITAFRGIERGCRHAEGFIRHVQGPDVPLP